MANIPDDKTTLAQISKLNVHLVAEYMIEHNPIIAEMLYLELHAQLPHQEETIETN